jgi:glycosyltransferase involved in cell wall biosynthesis
MKILTVFSDYQCSCTLKNTFEIHKGFLSLGKLSDILFYTDLSEDHFKYYDIIVFQRLGGNAGPISKSYFNKVKKLIDIYRKNVLTVYTIDDLLTYPEIIEFCKIVDVLSLPNKNLNNFFEQFNNNIINHFPWVDLEFIKSVEPKDFKNNKYNIIWASTGLLGLNFAKKLILEITRKFPESIVHILSSEPVREFKNNPNINMLPILNYKEYISYVKGCNLVLNPISVDFKKFRELPMEDFINCKSAVKYCIAAACQVPIISSKSDPYDTIITNSLNGFILNNDTDLWVNFIKVCKDSTVKVNKIIKEAYLSIENNYNLLKLCETIYQQYFETYSEFKKIKHKESKKPIIILDIINNEQQDLNIEGNSFLGEFFNNRVIKQNFISNFNNLCKISIKFATYCRPNNSGSILFILKNDKGGEVFKKEINISDVIDNSWHNIDFKPIIQSKGKNFTIELTGKDCRVGNSVSLYFSKEYQKYGQLKIGSYNFSGTLCLKTYYSEISVAT